MLRMFKKMYKQLVKEYKKEAKIIKSMVNKDMIMKLIETLRRMDNKALAIVCITIIELYALSQGIDGVMLANVIAIISGLAGYEYGKVRKNAKKK